MSQTVQERLAAFELARQERIRRENEEAEIEHRSKAYAVRRCRKELGITEPRLTTDIANAVVAAEKDERREMTAVHIYAREVQRLEAIAAQATQAHPSERLNIDRRIRDGIHNMERAQGDLDRGAFVRTARLKTLINLAKVESVRLPGLQRADNLASRIAASASAGKPFCKTVPWDTDTITVGEPSDYLTLHNREYPRGTPNGDIGPHFRNIIMQGKTIEICALKHSHASWYGQLMGNANELPFSRPEPDLLTARTDPKRQTKPPVYQRLLDLATDAGRGRGYALVLKSHEADGPFYGIASYNAIMPISPRDFFGDVHFESRNCRMVDFNFQLLVGRVSIDQAVEIGTLLIEYAREYFGAELFRSQCSPLDAQYSDTMAALGLQKYKAIEPASYDPAVAAATWKFDFCAWKNAKRLLQRHGHWYIYPGYMKDPDNIRRPPQPEPVELVPALAIVEVAPTAQDDPAAYQAGPIQAAQAAQAAQGQSVQQSSESMDWTSSYLSGTMVTSDSGTTSGVGHSESSRSNSTTSDSHDDRSGTSSGSSASSASGRRESLIIQGDKVTEAARKAMNSVWQGSTKLKAIKDKEDSLAMPPPPAPQPSSSSTASLADTSQSTSSQDSPNSTDRSVVSTPTEVDFQYPTTPATMSWLPETTVGIDRPDTGMADASTHSEFDASAQHNLAPGDSHDRKGKQPASASEVSSDRKGKQPASASEVPVDRKGKRPASVSSERRSKRRSPLGSSSTPDNRNYQPLPSPSYSQQDQDVAEQSAQNAARSSAVFANSNQASSSHISGQQLPSNEHRTLPPDHGHHESTQPALMAWQSQQESASLGNQNFVYYAPPTSQSQQSQPDFGQPNDPSMPNKSSHAPHSPQVMDSSQRLRASFSPASASGTEAALSPHDEAMSSFNQLTGASNAPPSAMPSGSGNYPMFNDREEQRPALAVQLDEIETGIDQISGGIAPNRHNAPYYHYDTVPLLNSTTAGPWQPVFGEASGQRQLQQPAETTPALQISNSQSSMLMTGSPTRPQTSEPRHLTTNAYVGEVPQVCPQDQLQTHLVQADLPSGSGSVPAAFDRQASSQAASIQQGNSNIGHQSPRVVPGNRHARAEQNKADNRHEPSSQPIYNTSGRRCVTNARINKSQSTAKSFGTLGQAGPSGSRTSTSSGNKPNGRKVPLPTSSKSNTQKTAVQRNVVFASSNAAASITNPYSVVDSNGVASAGTYAPLTHPTFNEQQQSNRDFREHAASHMQPSGQPYLVEHGNQPHDAPQRTMSPHEVCEPAAPPATPQQTSHSQDFFPQRSISEHSNFEASSRSTPASQYHSTEQRLDPSAETDTQAKLRPWQL